MIKKSILKKVQKPGRYLGTEVNTFHKEKTKKLCQVCFAFPDLYELGMSYLGLQILYSVINEMESATCERVFAPALDFEDILRKKKMPLTSLESNTPLYQFDIVGFSLLYELCYTNVLNMLALGKIPLLSRDRRKGPLVIAGGPCTLNPEVLADYIDAFVIGDGEEVFPEIITMYAQHKKRHGSVEKLELLRALSQIEGLYIPQFYAIQYTKDNIIKDFTVTEPCAPRIIKKRIMREINGSAQPVKPIIPYIQTVHNRACVEIMRGCPHTCKFCQARQYYYPCRIRKPDSIVALAKEIIAMTGYGELSLLSLSSGTYPDIANLLQHIQSALDGQNVSLSLPSMRVEKLTAIIPYYLSMLKKSGLTFAPEAGSERLRKYIGKDINIDYLKKTVRESYKIGYNHIKLYFMIGLPTETYEDLDEMVRLVYEIAKIRLDFGRKPGYVHLSIGTFIAKPHTFFERYKIDTSQEIIEKQKYIRQKFKKSYIKYNFTPIDVSLLEAALSRGNRQIGKVIYEAWHRGARLDAWHEHYKADIWRRAFMNEGIDWEKFATSERSSEEILPWMHVDI